MPIADDFSVAANGDIRYTGTGTNYTVIALHRWLGDLMDDAQASGNDILDITSATASARSTDNIITLNSPYNIDDIAAQHLYDGSIIQKGGDEVYDGVLVFANAGMYLEVLQNGLPIAPNFWETGLNADAAQGISHRFMLKVRTGGSDIDGKKLIGMTREFGYTYSEFKINGTANGNNVMALTYATDLNNGTASATVKGWTTITNTEGYRALDVDGNTTPEYYYSEWDKTAGYTINQFYERIKWLTRRSTEEDYNSADTGTDYALGNGTNVGQAQAFAVGAVDCYLTRVRFHLKKFGSPTGNLVAKLYAISGAYGSAAIPTGTALATSENLDVSTLTTSYLVKEIGFTTQFKMTASTDYAISLEYSDGDASNYVQVEGAASGTHAGNSSTKTGAWAANASADLWFYAFSSPEMYGVAGERVRGITHEIALTGSWSGAPNATELISWTAGSGGSAGTGIMFAVDSTTTPTKMWIQVLTGAVPGTGATITTVTTSRTVSTHGSTTPLERTLSFPLCGVSTGSAIIGSYGFGILPSRLTAADKLFDLTNTQRTPPNNVTFVVGGLSNGNDRVLVGPATGNSLQVAQFTLNGALSGGEATITVNSTIPTDTPASGTIRVFSTAGVYTLVTYTGYSGTQFTGCTGTPAANNGANVFISYIDKLAGGDTESFTSVYLADRSLFVRVRCGVTSEWIKTFETTGSLGSAGGSATAIRTPDV
jgi:hypothetical protein